ncbi:DUF397 domain-containing protein [Actinoplanes campanulatus]|uniref:DUF397 domain-containing protein n=1 Tax=Actinoplanes campanulatus TaxID=113559 RepID=UPI001954E93E|nr:DUF397 domain-containing protein [Actinoplanes capillaceus]
MTGKTYATSFNHDTATWQRSGSPGAGYVEVAAIPDGGAAIRNSEDPETILFFTKAEWEAFKGGVKDREFDL